MGVHRTKHVASRSCGVLGRSSKLLTSSHVKLSVTRRSEAGIGSRGASGDRIRNHGQRQFKMHITDGHVAGRSWQVADVKRPLMSVAKMVASGNRVHLDSKDSQDGQTEG